MILRLIPIIFSLLVLAAHFSRINFLPLAILSLLMIVALFIRRKWIPRIVQIYLLVGSVEWIRMIFVYVEERKLIGDDYQRLAIILGGVTLFTLLSGLMFETRKLKEKYGS
ncbi:MAG: hypothetical protein KAS71_07025 [Bacteroidales bacterium]|nr:hypothetical protein [Bacteroidales bacterium]